jgi:nicotinamide-nucleotide amidase
VSRALGRPLDEDAAIVAAIEARFARRGLPMPSINRRQAQVPRGGIVLPNPAGTAPGLWIDVDESAVVLLPGPPRELRAILEGELAPRLEARAGQGRLERRVLKMTGKPESTIDQIASPIYRQWIGGPMPIETTILAAAGQIELHLLATSDGTPAVGARLDAAAGELADALGDIIFSTDGRAIEVVVGDALKARGWWLATAESCTGGGILARLTDVPGSSSYVRGGVVAYDNAVKTSHAGVPAELLVTHGAVSEPVARAMADGVRAGLVADVAVAVTGIAGPTGGTPDKPVGTVVIAVAAPDRATLAKTFLFVGDRQMIRTQSVMAALDLVRRALTS